MLRELFRESARQHVLKTIFCQLFRPLSGLAPEEYTSEHSLLTTGYLSDFLLAYYVKLRPCARWTLLSIYATFALGDSLAVLIALQPVVPWSASYP